MRYLWIVILLAISGCGAIGRQGIADRSLLIEIYSDDEQCTVMIDTTSDTAERHIELVEPEETD